MELTVENLAKIASATIDLNGLTIICGINDSGKSTFGKALCALMNAFTQLKSRGLSIRRERLSKAVDRLLGNKAWFFFTEDAEVDDFLLGKLSADDFVEKILVDAREQIDDAIDEGPKVVDRGTLKQCIEEVRDLDEKMLQCVAVQRCFSSAFNGQYTPLLPGVVGSTILRLKDKSELMEVELGKDSCAFRSSKPIQHNAWYISDPEFVGKIGRIRGAFVARNQFEWALTRAILDNQRARDVDPVGGSVDAVLLQNRLENVSRLLDRAIGGEIGKGQGSNQGAGFVLRRKEWGGQSLLLANASMGLKSLALLRIMLDADLLQSGDILVLDEPEIHLHPDWQLIYAEALVLLRKELNLTILLTSHSPDFIQAVSLYAEKHGVANDFSAYCSKAKDAQVTMDKVADLDDLFDLFVPTIQKLEGLAKELKEGGC